MLSAGPGPRQQSDQCKISHDIKCEFSFSSVKNGLHGTDRTGPEGSRAGVAVHAGNAEVFQRAFVDRALGKSLQVGIGKDAESCLDRFPEAPVFFQI